MTGIEVFGFVVFVGIVYGLFHYFKKQASAKAEAGTPTKEHETK